MLREFITFFLLFFKRAVCKVEISQNGIPVFFLKNDVFSNIVNFLKNSIFFKFDILTDIFGIDNLTLKNKRFEVVYCFVSTQFNIRILVVLQSEFSNLYPFGVGLNSIEGFYSSANWLEREVWDLYGLFFFNHSDLRRILTDYGFKGFPLRKDFPLTGFVEVKYDELKKTVVYERVKLAQEFRVFSFINPWAG